MVQQSTKVLTVKRTSKNIETPFKTIRKQSIKNYILCIINRSRNIFGIWNFYIKNDFNVSSLKKLYFFSIFYYYLGLKIIYENKYLFYNRWNFILKYEIFIIQVRFTTKLFIIIWIFHYFWKIKSDKFRFWVRFVNSYL